MQALNMITPLLTKTLLLPRLDGSESRNFVRQLVQRMKTLRLHSLQANPEAFASSYHVEVKFEDDVWETRLKNPQAQLFIGLDVSNTSFSTTDDSDQNLLQLAAHSPWIGTTVLFGPKTFDGSFPTASVSPTEWFSQVKNSRAKIQVELTGRAKTLIFSINGVFVMPEWRKHKITTQLLQNANKLAQKLIPRHGKSGDVGACLVFVDEDNPIARSFYEKNGFVQVRKESYTTIDGKERVALALQLELVVA